MSVVLATLVVIGVGVGIVAAIGMAPPLYVLGANGIGKAQFGEPKATAVQQLVDLLGRPTASQASSGCGPRYSEVEWGDLAAEFRFGFFSGYRYLDGGLLGDYGLKSLPVTPRLGTAHEVTLGSTLGQVRTVFGPLRVVGTNRSEASDGLIFYDDAQTFPDPSGSLIVEIKIGTCGDY